MWTIPFFQCIGCHQGGCSGTCLATHRDRYCCHNPSCFFHAPRPAPPEPSEQGTAQAATASSDETNGRGASSAGASADSDVICRETIVREWRPVGGGGARATDTAAPTTTPAANESATTTTAAGTTEGLPGDSSSTSPATFTIEEYEAQERLLSQYQQPQVRQPQWIQLTVRTRRNGGENEAESSVSVRLGDSVRRERGEDGGLGMGSM